MKKEKKIVKTTPVVKKKITVKPKRKVKKKALPTLGNTGFGRPPKFQDKFCREIISLMASGYSIEDFAAEIGVDKGTIYNWARKYPDFFNALKIARVKGQAFWLKVMRHASLGTDLELSGQGEAKQKITSIKNILPAALIFNVKNRLGWRDQIDVNVRQDPIEKMMDDEVIEGEEVQESQTDRVKKLFKKYGTELAIAATLEDSRKEG